VYIITCTCTVQLHTSRSSPTSGTASQARPTRTRSEPHVTLKTSTRARQRKSSSWSPTRHATSTPPRLRVFATLTPASEITSWGCLLRERNTVYTCTRTRSVYSTRTCTVHVVLPSYESITFESTLYFRTTTFVLSYFRTKVLKTCSTLTRAKM